jgi:hypothetical protein
VIAEQKDEEAMFMNGLLAAKDRRSEEKKIGGIDPKLLLRRVRADRNGRKERRRCS